MVEEIKTSPDPSQLSDSVMQPGGCGRVTVLIYNTYWLPPIVTTMSSSTRPGLVPAGIANASQNVRARGRRKPRTMQRKLE